MSVIIQLSFGKKENLRRDLCIHYQVSLGPIITSQSSTLVKSEGSLKHLSVDKKGSSLLYVPWELATSPVWDITIFNFSYDMHRNPSLHKTFMKSFNKGIKEQALLQSCLQEMQPRQRHTLQSDVFVEKDIRQGTF